MAGAATRLSITEMQKGRTDGESGGSSLIRPQRGSGTAGRGESASGGSGPSGGVAWRGVAQRTGYNSHDSHVTRAPASQSHDLSLHAPVVCTNVFPVRRYFLCMKWMRLISWERVVRRSACRRTVLERGVSTGSVRVFCLSHSHMRRGASTAADLIQ